MTPRSIVRTAALAAAVGLVVAAAALVDEPLAFPHRTALGFGVICAAAGLALALRRRAPTVVLACCAAWTAWTWSAPWRDARAVWADLPAARAVGRHVVIGCGDVAEVRAAGVTPTAKHFPGLGAVATDTHLFAAALSTPRAALEAADWRPFRAVLAVPGAALMMSHTSLEAVDPGVPASRSRRVVEGLIRGEWGFDGLVVTDDLTMGAAVHPGLCRSVEGALGAGVDLLLVSRDTDRVYPALRCAAEAARAGRLDPALLARSDARLDRAPPPAEARAGPWARDAGAN